ncbi:MAG: alpha/beta hydrolase, partial [Solirubrobacteraceae bacterium]
MQQLTIDTPRGPAAAHVSLPDAEHDSGAPGALVLGHGAGGGIDAPDLRATRDAVAAAGFAV